MTIGRSIAGGVGVVGVVGGVGGVGGVVAHAIALIQISAIAMSLFVRVFEVGVAVETVFVEAQEAS